MCIFTYFEHNADGFDLPSKAKMTQVLTDKPWAKFEAAIVSANMDSSINPTALR
jgi:hypothetical protein